MKSTNMYDFLHNCLPSIIRTKIDAFSNIEFLAQTLINNKGKYNVNYTSSDNTYYSIYIQVDMSKDVVVNTLKAITNLSVYSYNQYYIQYQHAIDELAKVIYVYYILNEEYDMNITLQDAICTKLNSTIYEFFDGFTFSPIVEESQSVRFMGYDIIIKPVLNGDIRGMLMTLYRILENNKYDSSLCSAIQDLFQFIYVSRIRKVND